MDINIIPAQSDGSDNPAKRAGQDKQQAQASQDTAELSIHRQIILKRWLLVSKMDASGPLPSPCVSICLTNEENICTGCFRRIDEIAGWASFSPRHQLQVWNNLIKRIGITSAPCHSAD